MAGAHRQDSGGGGLSTAAHGTRSRDILVPANFSPCRRYRYTLSRDLDANAPGRRGIAVFCGLNPSTADEHKSDPTCTREMRFASAWGYRHYVKVNAFAWRDTDPRRMRAEEYPVGPDNDRWILKTARAADILVLAWGCHGSHRGRAAEILRLLKPYAHKLHVLKLTKDGQPGHPLYLRSDLRPIPFA